MSRLLYIIIAIIFGVNSWYFYRFVYEKDFVLKSSSLTIFNFICINILVFVLLIFFIKKRYSKSLLQSRVIITFLSIAAIPSILIMLLSLYFCYKNTKIWLDNKIVKVIENSSEMINLYVQDTKFQMKQMLLDIAEIIDQYEYLINEDPEALIKILNGLADIRSLDEIILFDGDSKAILSQTTLGLSLSVIYIKDNYLQEAAMGNVLEVTDVNSPYKIKMITKINETSNTYLIISKFIEKKILKFSHESQEIIVEYNSIKDNIEKLQIQFSIFFVAVSISIIIISIIIGRSFTNSILSRLEKLLKVVENVKKGQIDIKKIHLDNQDDEIGILNCAFITMFKQLEYQKTELLATQRSSTWADIARKVAHEINNPLTPIMLISDRLIKKYAQHIDIKERDKFEEHVKSILSNVKNISVILKAFTNFAKLPDIVLGKLNLYNVLSDLLITRKLIFDDIEYKIDSYSENVDFICDIGQINQMFLNLIKNAEEAIMDSKKIINSSKTKSFINEKIILIRIKQQENFLIVEIIDSGDGFDEKLKNKITAGYFTTKTHGTGLGLGISEKIITEHFGTIQLKNNNDEIFENINKNIIQNTVTKTDLNADNLNIQKSNNLKTTGARVIITFDLNKLKKAFEAKNKIKFIQ